MWTPQVHVGASTCQHCGRGGRSMSSCLQQVAAAASTMQDHAKSSLGVAAAGQKLGAGSRSCGIRSAGGGRGCGDGCGSGCASCCLCSSCTALAAVSAPVAHCPQQPWSNQQGHALSLPQPWRVRGWACCQPVALITPCGGCPHCIHTPTACLPHTVLTLLEIILLFLHPPRSRPRSSASMWTR